MSLEKQIQILTHFLVIQKLQAGRGGVLLSKHPDLLLEFKKLEHWVRTE